MAQSKGEKMNRNRPQGRRNGRSPDKTLKTVQKILKGPKEDVENNQDEQCTDRAQTPMRRQKA